MSSALDAECPFVAAQASAPPDLVGVINQLTLNATLASAGWSSFSHALARPNFLDNWQAMALHQEPSSSAMSVALLHFRAAQSSWPAGGAVRGLPQITDRDTTERRIMSTAPEMPFALATQPWVRWDLHIAAGRLDPGSDETFAAVVDSHNRASQLRAIADWSTAVADLDWDHLDSIDQVAWGQITDA